MIHHMKTRTISSTKRRGATIVEFAFVVGIFFLFLFGIFEYCRYLLALHVTTNATREGARYAVVNLDKPADFPTTAYTYSYTSPLTRTRTYPSIETVVKSRMAGVDQMIAGYTVDVFPCDTTQLFATTPVITPKSGSTRWNDAGFGERIAVRVRGTYTPLLPNLLMMNSSIPINIVSVAGSEG